MSYYFSFMRFIVLLLAALAMVSCGEQVVSWEEFHTRTVRLPDGSKIKAEVVNTPAAMARGLMFREKLAPNQGMLFIHPQPGKYPYWMYQTLIPLDIIWMDKNHRIVEIAADVPPCKVEKEECPSYGGNEDAQYVLEIGGGLAAKHGLKVGGTLRF